MVVRGISTEPPDPRKHLLKLREDRFREDLVTRRVSEAEAAPLFFLAYAAGFQESATSNVSARRRRYPCFSLLTRHLAGIRCTVSRSMGLEH